MWYADRLALALPKRDVNGDHFEFIRRDRVFEELHGLIQPIRHTLVAVEHDPSVDPRLWLTQAEEIQAGRARLIADLNTDEGRAAFLECWWPRGVDGLCLAHRAERGNEDGLPFPTHTLLRRAVFLHLLEPDLLFSVMRFGARSYTTTLMKAHWDCGVRRILFHPIETLDTAMRELFNGVSSRLIPLAPNDPRWRWTLQPGHHGKAPFAYYIDLTDRPKTNDSLAWFRGKP